MKLIIVFDIDADLIEVPQYVIDNKEFLQKKFRAWLYNKKSNHKYRVTIKDHTGKKFDGMKYRSDAFVEWLNRSILSDCTQKASVIDTYISDWPDNTPTLYF